MDAAAGLPGRPMAALGMLLAAGSIAFTGSAPPGADALEPAGPVAAAALRAVVVPAVSAAGWVPAGEGLARVRQIGSVDAHGKAVRGGGAPAERAGVGQALLTGAPAALPGGLALSHPVASVTITSRFGWRLNPTGAGSQLHIGQDYAMACGSPVRAAEDGTVVQSEWAGHSGQRVAIEHRDGVRTAYSHNSLLLARVGQRVKRGDLVALSGTTGNSTGCHVHFEVYLDGQWVDPALYLPRVPGQPAPLTPHEQLAVRDSLAAGSALARPGTGWASAGASGVAAATAPPGSGQLGSGGAKAGKSTAAKSTAAKSKTAKKKESAAKATDPAKAPKKPSGTAGTQQPPVEKPDANVPATPVRNPVPAPAPAPVPAPAPDPEASVPPAGPVVGGGETPVAPAPALPQPPASEDPGSVQPPAGEAPAAKPEDGGAACPAPADPQSAEGAGTASEAGTACGEENPAALEPITQ